MPRSCPPMISHKAMTGLLLGMLIAAFGEAPLAAQSPQQKDFATDMAGSWEVGTAERSRTCAVTLKTDVAPMGLKIDLDADCGRALPFMAQIVAWNVRGLDGVRLLDAQGNTVLDLAEVESGIFEARRPGEGIYLMQNLEAARAVAKSMDNLVGDWSVLRGKGQSICRMTLTNTSIDADNFAVFLNRPCEAMVALFNPYAWRLERGEILMMSRAGDVWRFEPDDLAQWRRVPDSADPIYLSRQ